MRIAMKNNFIVAAVFAVMAVLLQFMVVARANAATMSVACADLPTAVAAASAGDTLNVTGDCTLTSTVTINKQLTIHGDGGATISTNGGNLLFAITPAASGTVIDSLNIVKTDKVSQNLVQVLANDVTISNNSFTGQYTLAANDSTSRALEVGGSLTGLNVTGNSFENVRQPAYINNLTSGTISNNYVNETRGFVVVSDTDLTFTGNSFGTNALDIVFINQDNSANNYSCDEVRQIVLNNNGAVVQNQTQTTPCPTYPSNKDECKGGGYKSFTGRLFKNQGECVSFVASGGKSGGKSL